MLFRATKDFTLDVRQIKMGSIMNVELNGLWEDDNNPVTLVATFEDRWCISGAKNYVRYMHHKDIDVLRKNIKPVGLKI